MIEFMPLEVENVYRIKIFSFLPQKKYSDVYRIKIFSFLPQKKYSASANSSTNLNIIYNLSYNYLKKR